MNARSVSRFYDVLRWWNKLRLRNRDNNFQFDVSSQLSWLSKGTRFPRFRLGTEGWEESDEATNNFRNVAGG